MKTIDLIQGSPEWLAHRAQHFNASDAPAMLGCSPYTTRTELLARMKTGISAEVDAATQKRFDDGHRFEALARPLAEKIIGEELSPVTGTNGQLSASFDGLTFMGDTAFEHKTLGEPLRYTPWDEGNGYHLPLHYQVQMEQQLLVSGADRVLFMATKWDGDTMSEERHCWYASDAELRAKIIAGWAQFAKDLVEFVPTTAEAPKPIGRTPDQLPALRSSVKGELVLESNIKEWETAALAYIQTVRDHELKTDEDFENADAAARWCDTSKTTLQGLKASLMSATGDVNTAVGTLDRIMDELDKTRIQFTNASKARKTERKGEIVAAGVAAFAEHIRALNATMPANYMPVIPADFGGCIKNLRTFASIQNAVNTELANAKICANEIATRIQTNIGLLDAANAPMLFADISTLVLKAPDDLAAVIAQRLAAEAQRKEAETARIRAEEAARLEREAKAESDRLERERAHAAQVEADRIANEIQQANEKQTSMAMDDAMLSGTGILKVSTDGLQRIDPADAAWETTGYFTPQQAATRILAARLPEVKPADDGARLTLGEINERLAPISISVAGLTTLGFDPVAVVKAARLYRASDFKHICAAISEHVLKAAQAMEVA